MTTHQRVNDSQAHTQPSHKLFFSQPRDVGKHISYLPVFGSLLCIVFAYIKMVPQDNV